MGWGCSAVNKRVCMHPANEHYMSEDGYDDIKILQQVRAVVIDVNAVLRQMLAPGCTLTPRTAVRILFHQHVTCCSSAEIVVFAFDSPDKVPVERNVFHENVRYPKATRLPKDGEILAADGRLYKHECRPIDQEDIQHITMDHIPGGSWDRVWNSKEGKKKMWDIIFFALEDFLLRHCYKPCVYIIDTQQHGRVYIPPVWEKQDMNKGSNWGEADAKVLQYALCLKEKFGPVLISSIDWDMPLQALVHDTNNVYVRMGVVFSTPDNSQLFFSKGMASRVYTANKSSMEQPRRCIEIINCTKLMAKYPSRCHRLEALFWCLSAGGIDYCRGLSSFGINEGKCVKLLESTQDASYVPFIQEGYIDEGSPMVRCASFDIHKLIRKIIAAGPTRIRKNDIGDLNTELQRIIFCVLYFIGFDPQRTRAGPMLRTDSLFSGKVQSVSECFSGAFIFEKVYYSEMFPETIPRMNPFINYSKKIAELIT